MDFIADFMDRYRREYDYYDQAARLATQLLDGIIQAAGIRAIISARPKNAARLEEKLRQRNVRKPYDSIDSVYEDIVDLAGIRIALYFPGDLPRVDRLVHANFDLLEEPKVFQGTNHVDSKKRFSGYWATHYRMVLRERDLVENQKRYGKARIELQVASVLMHAWSEVEHDLVYKPFTGEVSRDEYEILDELNGLVLAGEIALNRLQRAIEARVNQADRRFSNHYELAAFLFDVARQTLKSAPDEAALGHIDLLFVLLQRLDLNKPNILLPYVKGLDGNVEERPIADQLIDQVISQRPDWYEIYAEVRQSFESSGAKVAHDDSKFHNAMGRFVQSWIRFETLYRSRLDKLYPNLPYVIPSPHMLQQIGFIDDGIISEIQRIRSFRNMLLHGMGTADSNTLESVASRLDEITNFLELIDPESEGTGNI